MLLYQGMVVLAANQVWWTWEVEDVFKRVKKGEKLALKNYGQKMHQQIDELVTRITRPMKSNDRRKINTVLIIDVHARDIVDKFIRDRYPSPSLFPYGPLNLLSLPLLIYFSFHSISSPFLSFPLLSSPFLSCPFLSL